MVGEIAKSAATAAGQVAADRGPGRGNPRGAVTTSLAKPRTLTPPHLPLHQDLLGATLFLLGLACGLRAAGPPVVEL